MARRVCLVLGRLLLVVAASACQEAGAAMSAADQGMQEHAGSGADLAPMQMPMENCPAPPAPMPLAGSGAVPPATEPCSCDAVSDAGSHPPSVDGGAGDSSAPGEPIALAVRQPEYDTDGQLIRPADVEQWVFMGTGVNLNYLPLPPGLVIDVLTVTLMEPSAYRHFKQTGAFAEGTMTALMVYAGASGAPPAEHGQYPGDALAFEMSVKDSAVHGADVWGYYGFGVDGQRAAAQPASECNACHRDSAGTDFVFTQFYPRMRSTTP